MADCTHTIIKFKSYHQINSTWKKLIDNSAQWNAWRLTLHFLWEKKPDGVLDSNFVLAHYNQNRLLFGWSIKLAFLLLKRLLDASLGSLNLNTLQTLQIA